jgi:hypothetical protein
VVVRSLPQQRPVRKVETSHCLTCRWNEKAVSTAAAAHVPCAATLHYCTILADWLVLFAVDETSIALLLNLVGGEGGLAEFARAKEAAGGGGAKA